MSLDSLLAKKGLSKKLIWFFISRISRDNARTPMQWSNKLNGGFSKGTPWLKSTSNFNKINVEDELKDKNSILNFYKLMISVRQKSKALINGDFEVVDISKYVFKFNRIYKGEVLTTIVNLSKKKIKTKITGKILINNYNENSFDGYVKPYQALVVKN